MKIDCDDMLDASHGEKICQHSSSNGSAMGFLLRLAGIWKVSCFTQLPLHIDIGVSTYGMTAVRVSEEVHLGRWTDR